MNKNELSDLIAAQRSELRQVQRELAASRQRSERALKVLDNATVMLLALEDQMHQVSAERRRR
jgi:hypothetical protein